MVKTAAVLALLMAAYFVLLAVWAGPLYLAVFAAIPSAAAIGILRRNVWSAVFFLAGRELERSGGSHGRPIIWVAISITLAAPFLFVHAYVQSSTSMEPTLLVGDRCLVRVFPKPTPARGDLVVFLYPINRREMYIKRVVGIVGDRIRLVNKELYVIGALLAEPYVSHEPYINYYRDYFPAGSATFTLSEPARRMLASNVVNGEVVVPQDSYFVLGDLVYDSRQVNSAIAPGNLPEFPPKIRWNRIFKVL